MARPRKDHGPQPEPARSVTTQPVPDTDKLTVLVDALLAHFVAEYGEGAAVDIVQTLKALRG